MIDKNKLTKPQLALLNAFVVGGIATLSSLIATGGIPTYTDIWTGFIAGALACLMRINDFLNREQENNEEEERKKDALIGVIV